MSHLPLSLNKSFLRRHRRAQTACHKRLRQVGSQWPFCPPWLPVSVCLDDTSSFKELTMPNARLHRRPSLSSFLPAPAPQALPDVLDIVTAAEPFSCATLIVDASASMATLVQLSNMPPFRPINRVNDAVKELPGYIDADDIIANYCELSVVRCGGGVSVVQDFEPAGAFKPPVFQASGDTPLAASLLTSGVFIEDWLNRHEQLDHDVCRPFILAITDGRPTDKSDIFWGCQRICLRTGKTEANSCFPRVHRWHRGLGQAEPPCCTPAHTIGRLRLLRHVSVVSCLTETDVPVDAGGGILVPAPGRFRFERG